MLRETEAASVAAAVHEVNECKDREGEVGGGAAAREDTWSVEVKAMLDENAPLVGSLRVVSKSAPVQGGGEGGGDGLDGGGGGGDKGAATVLVEVVPADGSEAFRVEMMCSGGGFCFRRMDMESGGGGEGQTYDTMSSLLLNVWYVAACVRRTRVCDVVPGCVWGDLVLRTRSFTHTARHSAPLCPCPFPPLPTPPHPSPPLPIPPPFPCPIPHNHPSHTAHLHRSVSTFAFLPGLPRSRTAPFRKARVAAAVVAAIVRIAKAKVVVGKAFSAVQPPRPPKASGIRPGKAKSMQPPPLRLLWRIGSRS